MADDSRRDDDGFLARWSRRKRTDRNVAGAQRRGSAAPVATARMTPGDQAIPAVGNAASAPPTVTSNGKPAIDRETEQEAALRDLPPLETLTKDSDFARFLKDGVPDALKQQALRQLWRLDPQFAAIDPFTEYGGDYTVVIPIDPIKDTIHRAGLGYLTPEELAEQRGEAKKTPDDEKNADRSAGGELAEAADPSATPAGVAAGSGDEPADHPAAATSNDEPAADESAVGPDPKLRAR
jgi:hypothetical protein